MSTPGAASVRSRSACDTPLDGSQLLKPAGRPVELSAVTVIAAAHAAGEVVRRSTFSLPGGTRGEAWGGVGAVRRWGSMVWAVASAGGHNGTTSHHTAPPSRRRHKLHARGCPWAPLRQGRGARSATECVAPAAPAATTTMSPLLTAAWIAAQIGSLALPRPPRLILMTPVGGTRGGGVQVSVHLAGQRRRSHDVR